MHGVIEISIVLSAGLAQARWEEKKDHSCQKDLPDQKTLPLFTTIAPPKPHGDVLKGKRLKGIPYYRNGYMQSEKDNLQFSGHPETL